MTQAFPIPNSFKQPNKHLNTPSTQNKQGAKGTRDQTLVNEYTAKLKVLIAEAKQRSPPFQPYFGEEEEKE